MVATSRETKVKDQPGSGNGGASRAQVPAPVGSGRIAPLSYGGWEPMRRLRDEFDRVFDQFFRGWPAVWDGGGRELRWGLDVHETNDSIEIRAEAPGFEPSEFDIQVQGNMLTLSATHRVESEEPQRGQRTWQQQEYFRSLTLPAAVDPDKVDARYRHGILTVSLPKTEEGKGRRIKVQG
jgi:HSP20 family protein